MADAWAGRETAHNWRPPTTAIYSDLPGNPFLGLSRGIWEVVVSLYFRTAIGLFCGARKRRWRYRGGLGSCVHGVPRHDVTDGAGRQVGSGNSNLLPGMYRPRATIKWATSEILPSEAVQAPQNFVGRSLRTHRKQRRWPDSPGSQTRQAAAEDSFMFV